MTTLIKEIESKLEHNVEVQNYEERVLDMVKGELKNAERADVAFLKERGYNMDRFGVAKSRNFLTREDIRTLAASYRFRCLPLDQFRGQIDPAVIQKMRTFEAEYINYGHIRYEVMAPVSMFELREPKDIDPLLFANLSGEYHLIHKWGNDATLLRKMLVFPLRNKITLAFTSATLLIAYWGLGSLIFGDAPYLIMGAILSVLVLGFLFENLLTGGMRFSDETEHLSCYNVFDGVKKRKTRFQGL